VYGGVGGGQMSRTRGGAAGLPSVAVRMINGHVADDDASVGRSVRRDAAAAAAAVDSTSSRPARARILTATGRAAAVTRREISSLTAASRSF